MFHGVGDRKIVALWGNCDYGTLGLGSLESKWRPAYVSGLWDGCLKDVACGGSHTFFLTAPAATPSPKPACVWVFLPTLSRLLHSGQQVWRMDKFDVEDKVEMLEFVDLVMKQLAGRQLYYDAYCVKGKKQLGRQQVLMYVHRQTVNFSLFGYMMNFMEAEVGGGDDTTPRFYMLTEQADTKGIQVKLQDVAMEKKLRMSGDTTRTLKKLSPPKHPKEKYNLDTATKVARAKPNKRSGDADLSKDKSGPESPVEFRRSWYVKGRIRSGVISSVLMQRCQRTIRQRYSPCEGPLSLEGHVADKLYQERAPRLEMKDYDMEEPS
ncbi:reverse transcriptase domain-containing protein [Tanacetum coccineum]